MIHTRIVSLVIVLSLVLFSNCTTAPKAKTSEPNKQATTDSAPAIASGDSIPVMKEWKARRFQLQNGLKVIVVTDHSSPTFAYQTWFNVGSRNEQKDYTGLAHLFEHLMFKATSNYADGEFSKQSEMAGAEGSNAFTTEDFTAYVQEFPKDKLDLIAQLESDRMVNLIVDENVFKTERDVVHNERRMRYENSADGILRLELKKMAYEKQPYRWPVIGYAEDLNRMTATDAVNFYKKYYHPSRAVIVVVGDVEFDQVKSTIEKNYGKIARAQVTSEELEPKLELETPLAQPIRNQLSLNTGVEKLRIAYRIPSATQIDQPPIKILGSILSGGKSSRLDRALVNTGLASSVSVGVDDSKDPGLLIIYVTLQEKKHATQAETIALREIEKLIKEGISEKELSRAKNLLTFQLYGGLNSNQGLAEFLGDSELVFGDFTKALESLESLQKITADQILQVTKTYLGPQSRIVLTGLPKGEK